MIDQAKPDAGAARLTFAIPVFERFSYFEEALDSALNQTIACPVVVVDNGSSHDRFRELIQRKADPRIRFYRNERNLGMFANWNIAARHADTEFVMILGDDDYVLPGYAAAFEDALQRHPDIDAYYTAIRWFSEQPASFPTYTYPTGYQPGVRMLQYAARHGLGIPTTSLCLRRSLFAASGFREHPHGNSDWLFAYEALARSAVYGNPELLAGYRKHPESDTLSGNTALVTALSCVYIYWRIGELLDEQGMPGYAEEARRKALEGSVNLGLQWRQRYHEFLAAAPADHLYARFVQDVILPRSWLARALSVPHSSEPLFRLLARLRRKTLHLTAPLRDSLRETLAP